MIPQSLNNTVLSLIQNSLNTRDAADIILEYIESKDSVSKGEILSRLLMEIYVMGTQNPAPEKIPNL